MVVLNGKTKNWVVSSEEIINSYINNKKLTRDKIKITNCLIEKHYGESFFKLIKLKKEYTNITKFNLQNKLGSGSYADVYEYNKKIAIKKIANETNISGKHEYLINTYLVNNILFKGKSPCIPLTFQLIQTKKFDYIFMEKCEQNLWYKIQDKCSLLQVKQFLFQCLLTLHTLQESIPNFRHNDLKLSNILIQKITEPVNFIFNGRIFTVKNYLIKFADWDFCNINQIIAKKTTTTYAKTFGCTVSASKVYDLYTLLNNYWALRKKLPKSIIKFIEVNVPNELLVGEEETEHTKFGRLIKPEIWEGRMSITKMLNSSLFNCLETNISTEHTWGNTT